jgi:hypothetical protein
LHESLHLRRIVAEDGVRAIEGQPRGTPSSDSLPPR